MFISYIYVVYSKKKMKHSMTNKYLATMDGEIIECKEILWRPQRHLSPNTVTVK
jgi:ABC-type antimicrobial peptide transport system ATPase subunit